jgi:hypothetical protein
LGLEGRTAAIFISELKFAYDPERPFAMVKFWQVEEVEVGRYASFWVRDGWMDANWLAMAE